MEFYQRVGSNSISNSNQNNLDQSSIFLIEEDKLTDYYISYEIEIKDSGIGILKENLNKIFYDFSKLANSI